MKSKIAWTAAILVSTAAYGQTPAPTTVPPGAPPAATTGTVPEVAPNHADPSKSAAASAPAAELSAGDKRFVEKAASGGLAEVQAAQLAQQKAQDQKVKDFAQQMITDHTAANQQLTTLAQQKGLTVATALDDKDQSGIDRLQNLDGKKFDRAYMKAQLHDHQEMLKLLQKEAKNSKDTDLKSFAEQTIPTIQKHLDMIKADTTS
jgi:putative membrane protein